MLLWCACPRMASHRMPRRQKAGELLKLPAFAGMRHVKLRETRSAFWRFHTQGVSSEGVCTVECLYFFLKALVQHVRCRRGGMIGVACGP